MKIFNTYSAYQQNDQDSTRFGIKESHARDIAKAIRALPNADNKTILQAAAARRITKYSIANPIVPGNVLPFDDFTLLKRADVQTVRSLSTPFHDLTDSSGDEIRVVKKPKRATKTEKLRKSKTLTATGRVRDYKAEDETRKQRFYISGPNGLTLKRKEFKTWRKANPAQPSNAFKYQAGDTANLSDREGTPTQAKFKRPGQ